MAASRKKTSKVSKARAAKSRPKLKAKAKAKKTVKAKKKTVKAAKKHARAHKQKQPPPHPDETSVRLGPHPIERHPVPAGLKAVHPAPPPPPVMHPSITLRHH